MNLIKEFFSPKLSDDEFLVLISTWLPLTVVMLVLMHVL